MSGVKKLLVLGLVVLFASPVLAENVTMTTYYPAPSGNYDALTANTLTATTWQVTNGIVFAVSSANPYWVGKNTTTNVFTINPGGATGATGIVMSTAGLVGLNQSPTAGKQLAVTGDVYVTGNLGVSATTTTNNLTVSIASALAAASATTVTAATRVTTPEITSTAASISVLKSIAVTGTITATGDITTSGGAFMHSDERLKENVAPITDAVAKVQALNGVYFKFIGKEGNRIGLIAQNVEKTFPEAVNTDVEGMKSVDYASLVSVLIEAVKEQQVTINALKMEIDQIKSAR